MTILISRIPMTLVVQCLLAIIWSTCSVQSLAGATQNRLQWSKPIALPELTSEELVAVTFDTDVYSATQPQYQDIRLRGGEGQEVEFIVRHARGKRTVVEKRSWPANNIKLKTVGNNALEITLEIDTEKYPDWPLALRLSTPLKNFQHRVRLAASLDNADWVLLSEDLVFDYSQFMPVRDTELLLPADAETQLPEVPRYYQITIDEVTLEQQSQLMELTRNFQGEEETKRSERITVNRQPFRIDRIDLWNDEFQRDVPADLKVEYGLTVEQVETDSKKQETYVVISAQREPLTGMRLETPARNFSRSARVEVWREPARGGSTDPENNWRRIGTAQLKSIDFRTLQEDQLAIDFSETRAGKYRLVIENADSSPLPVGGVVGIGPGYQAVFIAKPQESYRLDYANANIEAPRYDTMAIRASLSEGFLPAAGTLGDAEELDVAPEPVEPLWKRLLANGPFVSTVIAALVLMLGLGLYRAANQIDAPPQK